MHLPDSVAPTANREATADVDVLFIAGIGRSGSTLLSRTLGAREGFVGTGELMRILSRGVLTGDLCGCGTPVTNCELWGPVLEEVAHECPDLDLAELEASRARWIEGRDLLRLLFVPGLPSGDQHLGDYGRFLAALYRAIRRVTGARVIVDASKSIAYAKLLAWTPGIRVSLVHLVRDPRGYAHSLARQKRRPGTPGRHEHFPQHGPVVASYLWSMAQFATEWVQPPGVTRARVRYEDFVGSPAGTVERILRTLTPQFVGSSADHIDRQSVCLSRDHPIASNPNRSERGRVALREDLAWQHEMARGRQWLVTALTWPGLIGYDYPIWLGRNRYAPLAPRQHQS